MKDNIRVLKALIGFLDKCNENDIQALIDGKAKITLEYLKSKPIQQIHFENTEDILAALNNFTNVEEAKNYLIKNNFSKIFLRQIAEMNNIVLMTKDTNETIINKIVEMLVGSKLKYDALLNMDLK